jgi:hypothetical protein
MQEFVIGIIFYSLGFRIVEAKGNAVANVRT